ncbi:hypothetical protein KKG61_04175 [bacterium]|nr:hypothetical protein [bacterium]MBU1599285.1 hypothetical protein [bacterium]MBU2461619.1 hypothetical protein [bacterium]
MREDIEGFIQKAENDEKLKSYMGRENRPLSGRLLNRVGSLMEREGLWVVKAHIKDVAKFEVGEEIDPAYQKLYEYVDLADGLKASRVIKGYLLKKLEAIATVKIE